MNTPNEEVYKAYEEHIRRAQLENAGTKLAQQQQEVLMQNREEGTITEQLDLSEILDRMNHLLRGYILKRNDETHKMEWCKPLDSDLVVLSEYGVSYVMWMLQGYLTKNTLLSNYNDKQIMEKMEDFATTLADNIFMEYDKMFEYPTLEDCKDELRQRIQGQVDIKKFACELLGKEVEEKELEAQVLKEMENRIEREMEVIKQQKIKNKLKRFESLVRMVQDAVHSAYQRAWKGQERTTLRQHIHVSETKGGAVMPQPNSGFNPFASWRKK